MSKTVHFLFFAPDKRAISLDAIGITHLQFDQLIQVARMYYKVG